MICLTPGGHHRRGDAISEFFPNHFNNWHSIHQLEIGGERRPAQTSKTLNSEVENVSDILLHDFITVGEEGTAPSTVTLRPENSSKFYKNALVFLAIGIDAFANNMISSAYNR